MTGARCSESYKVVANVIIAVRCKDENKVQGRDEG
jgi:hypothetical protein